MERPPDTVAVGQAALEVCLRPIFWTASASIVANWKFEGFFSVDQALVAWVDSGVAKLQIWQFLLSGAIAHRKGQNILVITPIDCI